MLHILHVFERERDIYIFYFFYFFSIFACSSNCSVWRLWCLFCSRSLHDQEFPNEPISCFKLSLTHRSCVFFFSLTCPYFPTNQIISFFCLPITEIKFSPLLCLPLCLLFMHCRKIQFIHFLQAPVYFICNLCILKEQRHYINLL